MSTKIAVALFTLITMMSINAQAQWRRVADDVAYNVSWGAGNAISRIPDVIIEGRRTKAQERTDLARINAEAGLCGMTTASNQNGAMVKVAAYPDGTPCVTGTPDERIRKQEILQEQRRLQNENLASMRQQCGEELRQVREAARERGEDPALYRCAPPLNGVMSVVKVK